MSVTAMGRREDVAKDLPCRHCLRGAHFVGERRRRRSDGGALVIVEENIFDERKSSAGPSFLLAKVYWLLGWANVE